MQSTIKNDKKKLIEKLNIVNFYLDSQKSAKILLLIYKYLQ